MASKKERLQGRLREIAAAEGWELIEQQRAEMLRQRLGPVGKALFRGLLRECGVPLSPLVEGVRQDDFAHLERTLLQLAQEYRQAGGQADRGRQRLCRRAVIEAKDHARLASRNPRTSREKQLEKEEMVLWMMTWLENPGVFGSWVALRKSHLREGADSPP